MSNFTTGTVALRECAKGTLVQHCGTFALAVAMEPCEGAGAMRWVLKLKDGEEDAWSQDSMVRPLDVIQIATELVAASKGADLARGYLAALMVRTGLTAVSFTQKELAHARTKRFDGLSQLEPVDSGPDQRVEWIFLKDR